MRVDRQFTTAGKGPYDGIDFRKATSEIRNPDGSVVFQNDKVEAPEEEEVVEEPVDKWAPDSPSCPVCDRPMAVRTVQKEGPHKGKKFWACFAFPDCRGVREYKPDPGERPPRLLP